MKKKAVWAAATLMAVFLAAGCNNTDGTELDLNGGSPPSFTNTPADKEDSAVDDAADEGGNLFR